MKEESEFYKAEIDVTFWSFVTRKKYCFESSLVRNSPTPNFRGITTDNDKDDVHRMLRNTEKENRTRWFSFILFCRSHNLNICLHKLSIVFFLGWKTVALLSLSWLWLINGRKFTVMNVNSAFWLEHSIWQHVLIWKPIWETPDAEMVEWIVLTLSILDGYFSRTSLKNSNGSRQ